MSQALLKRRYDKLHLQINESKSAAANAFGRKFLGFEFWSARGRKVKRAASKEAREAFKQRIRQLTCQSGNRSIDEVIAKMRPYVLGWKAYFNLAQPKVLREPDE